MPDVNPTQLRQWQREIGKRSAEREKLALGVAKHGAGIAALDREIAQLAALGEAESAAAKRQEWERLVAARSADREKLGVLDEAIRDVLGRFAVDLDPGDADPAVPLVLLPVRLETRFTDDRRSLRVRIFPDDVHIDQLDRGLSEAESAAGTAYWIAVWRATDENAGTAWRTLLQSVGQRRALWVALALRPANLERMADEPAPEFGPVPPRLKRAAVARLLPDAFTAVAIQGAQRSTRTGRAILPEVPVGLFAGDDAKLKEVNDVKVTPGAEWLVDYAEAERVGLAVTVPLAQAGARVDRLLVFGVRRSLDPKSTPAELEALLNAHRCAQGLAFVPQGTPTNNTETDRAGWQRRIEPRPPLRTAAAPPDAQSNAAVLAAALGIDAAVLADLDHADEQEQARAAAMNVALWGPSWGGFLEKVNRVTKDGATLSDSAREDTRRFHRDCLRGRGPLPALRIGSQPYGILPVSCVERRWKTTRGDAFETGLLPMLARLRTKWRASLPNVPRAGTGAIDQALLEMLGSSAVSSALRVRSVISADVAGLGVEISGTDPADLEIERLIDELMFEEILNASLVHPTGSLGESRPLALPLVHESDPAFIDGLLANAEPAAVSVFQVLIELALDRAEREVTNDSGGGRLAEIVQNAGTLSVGERERTLAVAHRAEGLDAGTLFAEAKRVAGALGNAAPPTLAEFQPITATARSFGELALQSTSGEARAQLSLFATHAWLNSRGRLNELRVALGALKATALEERRILIAEALDLASHRLDAWLTGVVERRRRKLRETQPAGCMVGAYGWVEEIEPTGDRATDGGFVHAPSLTHAATAGVLRSAYLSHNADGSGNGAFAVDLSSARVRTAMHLIDGIRQGQSLSGLLGYRIERGIHEAGLDRLILSLRTIAPLSQGKLTDRNENVPQEAVEALAAANVVDGLELVEKYQGKIVNWGPQKIRAALDEKPTNNPYHTGDWPALTPAEWAKVARVIEEAAEALDATGDLLLAESVHQLVSGSTVRAGAALDAASAGDAPPPEPEVIATPGEARPFTHRILLVAGAAEPWNVTRPRSAAEPRMEGWAAARLGDPATIVIADGPGGTFVTMADTGWCALDVVYNSADRASFEKLPRAVAGAVEFYDARQPGWPAELRAIGDVLECAASLRSVLVNARPATPSDLALPNAPVTRAASAAGLQAARDRVQAARDLFALRCTMLDALVQAGVTDSAQLNPALDGVAAFGLFAPTVAQEQQAMIVDVVANTGVRRLQMADAALARTLTAETVAEAGQALFGDGFWILPAIEAPAAADAWTAALATPPPGASAPVVRRYLTDVASVRDGTRRFVETMLLAEAIGGASAPRVAQLAGVGESVPDHWVGGLLPLDQPTPNVPVLSAVLDMAGGYDGTGATVALVVDEWMDAVPVRERRGKAANDQVNERTTTGVTFHAMAPSARAPQAILLAVSPDGARWTGAALLDTLEETLDLARLRAVTLERTNGIARILPAIYERSWSLQGEKVLDFQRITQQLTALGSSAAYVKEKP
jgi:hypothetical protein